MARLSKMEIKTAVKQAIADAEGYDTDELAQVRKEALDYYYNRPNIAPSMEGRSSLQSSDVADMLEAVTAQIMPAFSGEGIVEVEPQSEDDVDQARAESNAVNWVVMEQNKGDYELQQAIRDALLLRNGVIKVYLDERIDTNTESYEMLTAQEMGQLRIIAGDNEGVTITDETEREGGFWDARVRTETVERKVCVRAVDPTYFMWERDWDSIYLDRCRFVAERSLPTRSELIEMGYSKRAVNALNAGGNDTRTDSLARNQNAANRTWEGHTKAEDIIECHECYIRLDIDGDGVAELSKVFLAAGEVLEVEPAEYIPYASGTPFLQPHRFTGLGLYDKLKNVQDQKTFGIRQWADNANNANNARLGIVDGSVNLDDAVNSRPGGIVRMTTPDGIVPIPAVDVGPSIASFLEYGDKLRSERGGAALDMQTAEMQVAGDTAHGVERVMSAKELLAAMMTRTLANTLIRTTYELVHQALRLYVPEELSFRVGSEFAQVNPAQWREREHFKVRSGLSPAERGRKQAQLTALIADQYQLMQAGLDGTMVDQDAMYTARLDWCRAGGIDMPENYFVDPSSQQGQQAAQGKAQQQERMMAEQNAQQQQLVQLQRMIEERKADNADAKLMEEGRQHDDEMKFKYRELAISQGTKEAEMALSVVEGSRNEQSGDSEGDSQQQSAG